MKFSHWKGFFHLAAVVSGFSLAVVNAGGNPPESAPAAGVTLVVMDPLAKELACACVKGYGQRDYRKLAVRLQSAIKQPVKIEFSDDLSDSLVAIGDGQQIVVIGDRSLVEQGGKAAGLKCRPICELSGLDGSTTLTGLFVARSDDSPKELGDIKGRTLFLGFSEVDSKHAAAKATLTKAGIDTVKLEERGSYSDAALDVLDSQDSPLPVAVIPAYALPLLEGCGSMTPGNLRVIGKTEPLPFITVFLSDTVSKENEKQILQTLLDLKADPAFLKEMESRDGFKALKESKTDAPRPSAAVDWPDWRGPQRDGRVAKLPTRLPEKVEFIWKKGSMEGSLAGLSVSGDRLILAERDFDDEHDVYRCLNSNTGELLWRVQFPAKGTLDYGQSPRATPLIHDGKAYLLGAFGDLRCVNVADGEVIWERSLPSEFRTEVPTWGMCSTPLLVDDVLIVNPGATNASLAALDRLTGRTRWTTPGGPAAYAAFILGEFGGQRQIVGYDQDSLGGWDPKTGARLWQLTPAIKGDFNVPTPIAADGGVIVSTENNGTRFYRFDKTGRIIPKAAGEFADLSPDTSTPVVTAGRVFGTKFGLYCLDLQSGLKRVWFHEDDSFGDYSSLIVDDERVLLITLSGELLLLDGKADKCEIISRLRVFEDDVEVYSHPALVGTRLYMRGGSSVVCLDLAAN